MSDDDKPQPDHTEDPRKQEQGSGGYPETAHEGAEDDDAQDPSPGDTPPGAAA